MELAAGLIRSVNEIVFIQYLWKLSFPFFFLSGIMFILNFGSSGKLLYAELQKLTLMKKDKFLNKKL